MRKVSKPQTADQEKLRYTRAAKKGWNSREGKKNGTKKIDIISHEAFLPQNMAAGY